MGIWEGGGVWILAVDFGGDFLDEFWRRAEKKGGIKERFGVEIGW